MHAARGVRQSSVPRSPTSRQPASSTSRQPPARRLSSPASLLSPASFFARCACSCRSRLGALPACRSGSSRAVPVRGQSRGSFASGGRARARGPTKTQPLWRGERRPVRERWKARERPSSGCEGGARVLGAGRGVPGRNRAIAAAVAGGWAGSGGSRAGRGSFTDASRTNPRKSHPYGLWSVFLRKAQLKLTRYAPQFFP